MICRSWGTLGDVIASLWFVRSLLAERGEHCCRYVLEYGHPMTTVPNHPCGRVHMTLDWTKALAPILLSTGWISGIEHVRCDNSTCLSEADGDTFNLNRFRSVPGMRTNSGDLRRFYCAVWPVAIECHRPVLTNIKPSPLACDALVCNRTARYRNPRISYAFLQHLDRPLFFLGLQDEYERFRLEVPRAEHLAGSLLETAEFIRGAHLFVGGQSSCWWLAEAMGQARVQETCPVCPNSIPLCPNGWDAIRQDTFQEIVTKLGA